MMEHAFSPLEIDAIVLECKDVNQLSDFYIRLLGWQKCSEEIGEWVDIVSPAGKTKIAFQQNDDYTAPTWLEEQGKQQQMLHLDFAVKDKVQLELSVSRAQACGASLPTAQYGPGIWTTLIDPAGHPFCFVIS